MEEPASDSAKSVRSGPGASLLIVDDNAAIHEMLGFFAEASGYTCGFALSGQAALDLQSREAFDVVLIDLTMSPMDGITLTRELTARDPRVRIIAMTGSTERRLLAAAEEAGAITVLVKPFSPDALLEAIESCLDQPK